MKLRAFSLAFLFSIQLLAYPIDPEPLRMLVENSGYIVSGYVKKIEQEKVTKDHETWFNTFAVIEIREVLQGKISKKTIRVSYTPELVCPAPPDYIANTTVLTFLDKFKGEYVTHALSYGAKTLLPDEIEIYKQRIAEMQAIRKMPEGHEKDEQMVECLVKCAENSVTRWEGTFDLSPESDFMAYYKTSKSIPFASLLSSGQKTRLKTAILGATDNAYENLGLIDLVYDENVAEMDQYLFKHLKSVEDNELFIAQQYMKRLNHAPASPRAQEIIDRFGELYFDIFAKEEEKTAELRAYIQEFLTVMKQ